MPSFKSVLLTHDSEEYIKTFVYKRQSHSCNKTNNEVQHSPNKEQLVKGKNIRDSNGIIMHNQKAKNKHGEHRVNKRKGRCGKPVYSGFAAYK